MGSAGRNNHTGHRQYIIVFICFFIWMAMQFWLVGVQYDDYGYYTLNYGARTPHSGTGYSFPELFRFLGEHYCEANGRLFYITIWLTLYKIGGLATVRTVAAATVTVIWYLLYRIGSHTVADTGRHRVYGAIVLCLCYGSMDIRLHQHGTYWFSAFYGYYVPIVTTMLFVICYEKFHRELAWRHMPVLVLLAFASAWSVETWSVGTVSLMLALFARECREKKRLDIKHLLLVGGSVAGLLILLKSPGIRQRVGERQWGLTDIKVYEEYVRAAFSMFFSPYNRRYLLFLLPGCCILAVVLYLQRHKVVDVICAALTAVMAMFTLADGALLRDIAGRARGTAALCMGIVLFSIMIPVCRYYYFKADEKRTMLLFAAAMSIASLAGVPEIQLRVYIPFEICSFLIVFDACYEVYEGVRKNRLHPGDRILMRAVVTVFALYLIGMTGLSIKNSVKIYKGYKENAAIDQYNNAAWLHVKEQIARGEDVSRVYLKRYVDDTYATVTPYQQEWVKVYIDQYYEIPGEVEYIYE